jgi:Flp pilus assembly protein TadG
MSREIRWRGRAVLRGASVAAVSLGTSGGSPPRPVPIEVTARAVQRCRFFPVTDPADRAVRHGRCGRPRGQGLVEFALAGPLFLAVLFGVVDGGFLLYAHNAVEYAVGLGSVELAAKGNAGDADAQAISAMDSAGLATTRLVAVSEIDIYRLVEQADGSLKSEATLGPGAYTCTSGGAAVPCVNRYSVTGGAISVVWPSSQRNVRSGTNDFVGVDVHYSYHYFVGTSSFSLVTTKDVRLEPQN